MRIWLHGLAAAAIGGAATAAAAAFADEHAARHPEILAKIAAAGAFVSVLGYLKRSPLPGPK